MSIAINVNFIVNFIMENFNRNIQNFFETINKKFTCKLSFCIVFNALGYVVLPNI